jgi:hypothetical protein
MINYLKTFLSNTRRNEKSIFLLVLAMLIVFRVWLMAGIPKMYLYAPHDDLYFAKMAHYLIHGQWMGPYSQMTLIKGPFYAFFMIFSFFTGLPLLLSETIFYVAACLILFFAIAPLIKNKWWRLLLFTLLLFIPASLATDWTLRVYRDFVYFALTLFVIAFSIGLFLRINDKLSSLVVWAAGLGLSMGAFMLCREEGVWIYPSLMFLLVSCILIIWFGKLEHGWSRSLIVLSPIIIWYIPILVVSYLNYSYYGFWGYSENLDKDFNRVINTIGRIKTGAVYPYNAITRENFKKAFLVSPLLAKLSPSIELLWEPWQNASIQIQERAPDWYHEEYPLQKPITINSHVMFFFRDVLATSGYYSNGKFPHEYLKQLADQLEAVCNVEMLDCTPGINIPYVGSIKTKQIPVILHFFADNIYSLLKLNLYRSQVVTPNIQNWPAHQAEFVYFEEFDYNPIDSRYFGDAQIANLLVGRENDIRLRIIYEKSLLMSKIQSAYIIITLPGFLIVSLGWFVMLSYNLIRRRKNISLQTLLVILFVASLLIIRIMTLALISANNGIDMSYYSASAYIFLYLVLSLMIFDLVDQITRLIFSRGKKDIELIPQKQ